MTETIDIEQKPQREMQTFSFTHYGTIIVYDDELAKISGDKEQYAALRALLEKLTLDTSQETQVLISSLDTQYIFIEKVDALT